MLKAPTLPKGYRFKVEVYKRHGRDGCNMVTLQRKTWIRGWVPVDYHFCNFNNEANPAAVLEVMNRLITDNFRPKIEGYNGFDGYYPPREDIG